MEILWDDGPDFPSLWNIQSLFGPQYSGLIHLILFLFWKQPILLNIFEDIDIDMVNYVCHSDPIMQIRIGLD